MDLPLAIHSVAYLSARRGTDAAVADRLARRAETHPNRRVALALNALSYSLSERAKGEYVASARWLSLAMEGGRDEA